MNSIRCFIAIEMSPSVRLALIETGEALAGQLPARAVRWVKPAGIHLTLKFLGDTDPDALAPIGDCLDDLASGVSPFQLQLGALGCFPNPRKPKVIWVGVEGQIEQLVQLQRAVEEGMAALGWEQETRRYTPHLTLGRVKDSANVVDARLPWGRRLRTGVLEAGSLCLVESELRPSGAVYTTRHESHLGE